MDNVELLLSDQKLEIFKSLDSLAKTAKDIISQKNKKIHVLDAENINLHEKLNNETKILKKNSIRLIPTTDELYSIRKNRKLSKALLNKEISLKNLKKNIIEIKKENDSKNIINSREMTAFKIIALELEEKEKIIKDNHILLETMENDKKNLTREKREMEKINSDLASNLEFLKTKNNNLENANITQLKTIETLSKELQSKGEKIVDLKNQFIQLLDNYNDILQRIS
jgi:chromosome segregation ATPase